MDADQFTAFKTDRERLCALHSLLQKALEPGVDGAGAHRSNFKNLVPFLPTPAGVAPELRLATRAAWSWYRVLRALDKQPDDQSLAAMGRDAEFEECCRLVSGGATVEKSLTTLIASKAAVFWTLSCWFVRHRNRDQQPICLAHPVDAIRLFETGVFGESISFAHERALKGTEAACSVFWSVSNASGEAPVAFGGESAAPAAYSLMRDFALRKSPTAPARRLVLAEFVDKEGEMLKTPEGFETKLRGAVRAAEKGQLRHLVVVEQSDYRHAVEALKKFRRVKISCLNDPRTW